jgi:hypothetical protein
MCGNRRHDCAVDVVSVSRQRNDVVLETKENVVIETTERLNEVSSTLYVDQCTVSDEGVIAVTAENKTGVATHTAKLSVVGKYQKTPPCAN